MKSVDWSALPADHPLAGVTVPKGLYLGTSSWSFPGWKGLLYEASYQEQRLAESGLAAYANCPWLGTVSLDKSYYRPLEEAEFRRLAAQVPESFRFVVKTPRDLVLPALGSGFDVESLKARFLEPLLGGLGSKLGLVLLQFPPGAWRSVGSTEGFIAQLQTLLKALPRELSYALEVRDHELLQAALARAMQGTTVSLCASVHPRLPSLDEQLRAVPPTPGTPLAFRWNLRPSLEYEKAREDFRPFDSLKSPDPARRTLLAKLVARALKAGRTVYVTANNKAEGCAPLSLKALADEVTQLLRVG